jgi:hypothetical protein
MIWSSVRIFDPIVWQGGCAQIARPAPSWSQTGLVKPPRSRCCWDCSNRPAGAAKSWVWFDQLTGKTAIIAYITVEAGDAAETIGCSQVRLDLEENEENKGKRS